MAILFLFLYAGILIGSRPCYIGEDTANSSERGGPRLVTSPFTTVVSDVPLRGLERNPVGVTDDLHDRPEEDGVSMPPQCHAQELWLCCALFEGDCGQWGVVHCVVRLAYKRVETDPASQSTT